jgi:N-acetylated-alpha-linked acidic dipeptidase
MKKSLWVSACILALVAFGLKFLWGRPDAVLRGFYPEHAAREVETEEAFRSLPTPERAQQDLWALSRVPHVAGTPEDYKTAQYVLKEFREAGLDAKIVEYRVLLPMPRKVKVDIVEPYRRPGPTPEGGGSRGKDNDHSTIMPAFSAYSPSGDVTAPVVYANYGLPEDYKRLKQAGVEAAGKIVLVRYGRCYRGVKAYVAEQNHAAGLLLYSDPADDGYGRGDVYPRGPWRPPTSVQRGAILYFTAYIGDPLTPGIAASKEAKRLTLKEAATLPHIPTAPLSYKDAEPILQCLEGPPAPREWQGALPFAYHLGPGAAKVHLKLNMDFQVRPIWDVVGQLPGTDLPDSWVVVGSHRDAWAYGAADPNSGTTALLAVARGMGELLRRGWRPRRTIVLGSWDGEEFGLLGSTEWAEDNAKKLQEHAVAYLNVDVGVCGPHFGAASVPSLGRLIREVTSVVTDPKSSQPLYSGWAKESSDLKREDGTPIILPPPASLPSGTEARVNNLGTGSDYTAFLQYLGVPSLDVGFSGPYGVYHSAYDDFYWMRNFGDPTFKYSVAITQVLGTLVLRLADSDILPFDYEEYGWAIQKYLRDLQEEIEPSRWGGKLPFADALQAALRFTEAARALDQRTGEMTRGESSEAQHLKNVNEALVEVERDFLLRDGLPNRSWFRHSLYAPGVYTGYAAELLPGVREAIARNEWAAAAGQLELIRAAIDRATSTLQWAIKSTASHGS